MATRATKTTRAVARGLIDVASSQASTSTTSTWRGVAPTSPGAEGDFAGLGRPSVGVESGGGRGAEIGTEGLENSSKIDRERTDDEKTHLRTGRVNGANAPISAPALAGVALAWSC
jgi:hypothetical protein